MNLYVNLQLIALWLIILVLVVQQRRTVRQFARLLRIINEFWSAHFRECHDENKPTHQPPAEHPADVR